MDWKKKLNRIMKDHGACRDEQVAVRRYVKAHDTLETAWNECEYDSWMTWLISALGMKIPHKVLKNNKCWCFTVEGIRRKVKFEKLQAAFDNYVKPKKEKEEWL